MFPVLRAGASCRCCLPILFADDGCKGMCFGASIGGGKARRRFNFWLDIE
jgi:hypothetical protein